MPRPSGKGVRIYVNDAGWMLRPDLSASALETAQHSMDEVHRIALRAQGAMDTVLHMLARTRTVEQQAQAAISRIADEHFRFTLLVTAATDAMRTVEAEHQRARAALETLGADDATRILERALETLRPGSVRQ